MSQVMLAANLDCPALKLITLVRPTFFCARRNSLLTLAEVTDAPWPDVPEKSEASMVERALVTSAVYHPLRMVLSCSIAMSVNGWRAFGVDWSSSKSEI